MPQSGLRRRWLLVNPHSGADSPSADELVEAAERLGIDCHLLSRGDDPRALARAARADALGVAGGDGTLSEVASVAVERDLPFACIPFGTRNHFARDIGLDCDPLAALDVFEGAHQRIDVGRVNGRLFLNNVSVGLYADLVHPREQHRRRGEVFAGIRALKRLARDHHRLRVRLDREVFDTRVLLVANNGYELSLFNIGARPSLTEGRLHLYAACGFLPRRWHERTADRFVVSIDERRILAAMDGEPVELEPPLEIECLPRALRVLRSREREQL